MPLARTVTITAEASDGEAASGGEAAPGGSGDGGSGGGGGSSIDGDADGELAAGGALLLLGGAGAFVRCLYSGTSKHWAIASTATGIIGSIMAVVAFAMSTAFWAGGVHALFVLFAGITQMSAGFAAICRCCGGLQKCKKCAIISYAVSAGLSFVGVIMLLDI